MAFTKLKYTITETEDGWAVDTGLEYRVFDTAVEAQAYAMIPKENCDTILVLTWEPTTAIGRQIVKAIT